MPLPHPSAEVSVFEKYRAPDVYRGSLTMPNFYGRDRDFVGYRTRIRGGIKDGPNFGGRYKVIQFVCGTGCSFVLVADVSTGQVYSFPHGGEYDQSLQLEYRISSMLIRAQWIPNLENRNRCLQEDLLLKDGRFLSLGDPSPVGCYAGYCDNGTCSPWK
jgi:hypothetical protein